MDLDFEDEPEEESVELPMPEGMALRDYQVLALEKIDDAWKTYSRVLAVLATGAGKTICFSKLTQKEVIANRGRVLILAHTEELLDQAADKLFKSTGLTSEREKADEHASLGADIVIASIQTMSKTQRLLGFPDKLR